MGTIVITTNMSLDGFVQDPDGREGSPLGGWFSEHGGEDLAEWARVETGEALGAQALLLGRRTDEWFAARRQARDGEWAGRLNSLPKYVASSTPTEPTWSNSTLVDEIRLVLFPVLLVGGERLFDWTGAKRPLRLINLSTIGRGLVLMTYEVLGTT